MFVCICRGITEAAVRGVGREGVIEPDALVAVFGLDDQDICCGQSRAEIDEFVELARTADEQACARVPVARAS